MLVYSRMKPSIVIMNPLNTIVSKSPRPKWMCKHLNAKILDNKNLLYKCILCNPGRGYIRVIPNSKNRIQPKKVKTPTESIKISPTIEAVYGTNEYCPSPKPGFTDIE